jgi:8-oxo-dGTP diphosphatase
MPDIIGFLLFLVSTILRIILFPVIYLYGFYKSAVEKKIGDYNYSVAEITDIWGNVTGAHLFNDVLITKEGYKFGNSNETISRVLSINRNMGTLTNMGEGIVWVLINIFDDPAFKND